MSHALSGAEWLGLLERLAEALGKDRPPVRLCLIGSAACLLAGMEGRTSHDLDIWRPVSDYDRLELKKAAEGVGLEFDPKSSLEPDRQPGLTELGEFQPVLIERMGRLEILRPPVENLIAAKLIRGEPKDLSDVRFLHSLYRPDVAAIRQIIARFSPRGREQAGENLVYLDVFSA